MRTPPSHDTTLRSHACSLGPALHRCQAFAPPASGITRAMAVRNSGAPRPATTGPVTPVVHDLQTLPAQHSCAACPAASLPTPRHPLLINTTPFVFALQRRPSRWPPRSGPRRSPSRSRCIISASLGHRPAHRSQDPSSTPSHDVFIAPRPPPRRRATTATCSSTRAPRASPATPTPSSTGSASRSRASPTRRVTWWHDGHVLHASFHGQRSPDPQRSLK